jgi:heat shock protein HtpX
MASAYSQQRSNFTKTWILIFVFITLVSVIFYLFATVFGEPILAVIGIFFSLFQAFTAYFWGDKIALAVSGGKEASEKDFPRIHFLVENLSKVADIPKPNIYISPDKSANAFACGRNPEVASICLNQGLLDLLNENELEGVIAHELAHIKNRDILIMTVTMVLSSVITFITDIGFRLMIFGGGNRDRNRSPVLIVIYILVLISAPIISVLIQLAVSRSREYLADATAVVFTRYPEGLISALNKLYKNPVPTSHYSTSMNHFFISPPKKSWGEEVAGWFSTHPSLEERIKALKGM